MGFSTKTLEMLPNNIQPVPPELIELGLLSK